jgi:hypothetical protein
MDRIRSFIQTVRCRRATTYDDGGVARANNILSPRFIVLICILAPVCIVVPLTTRTAANGGGGVADGQQQRTTALIFASSNSTAVFNMITVDEGRAIKHFLRNTTDDGDTCRTSEGSKVLGKRWCHFAFRQSASVYLCCDERLKVTFVQLYSTVLYYPNVAYLVQLFDRFE